MNKNKKMKIKSRLSLILSVAIVLVIGITSATVALLTNATAEKKNVFTKGYIDTKLEEPNYKYREPEDPNIDPWIDKNPFVTNQGTAPCLVRLKVEVDPKKIFLGPGINSKPANADDLWEEDFRMWLNFNEGNSPDEQWVYKDDGYWYYQGIVEPGGESSPLFTKVHWLKSTVGTDGKLKWLEPQSFNIYIKREAIFADAKTAEGTPISAYDENGKYIPENAELLWSNYRQDEQ